MSLDWSILHWIQSTLTCPALDILMPKITLLGNGGMIWLLASGGLLCTKKYRKQGIVLLCSLAAGVLVDRKSTRLNSSHITRTRMPSSA